MFKALKDNKIIAINDTGEFPLMNYDSIEEDTENFLKDFIENNGEFVLKESDSGVEKQKELIRLVRNKYLEEYIDNRAKSPLMWADVSDEEKFLLSEYRNYLLNYTEKENWYLVSPYTYEAWVMIRNKASSYDSDPLI